MAAMATTRGTAEIASAADMFTLSDRTAWSYDQPSHLANKLRKALSVSNRVAILSAAPVALP